MKALRNISALALSLFALLWTDDIVPGLIIACAALALSFRAARQPRIFEILLIVWCTMVVQTYAYVSVEFWRNLLIGLMVRLNTDVTDLSQPIG